MPKTEKLSREEIVRIEDKIQKLIEPLNEIEKATLYSLLYSSGMSLQKAHEMRVKAGAVN